MKKIEVVKQQDLKDCGACSLLCIIKYYEGYVPLEKIRDDTNTTYDGTTAFHLIKAAKNYGFDAMGVKVSDIHDKNIYLPCIAHIILKNGLQHFVVIYKITDKFVYLMDPAKGKVKMNLLAFQDIWDNILILLSPITRIVKYEGKNSIFSLFTHIFYQNRSLFIRICLANIFLMIMTIITSFYFQVGVSSIQNGKDVAFLKFILALFFLFTLFKVILNHLKSYYLNYLNKNIDVTLFSEFLEHIFHLPLNFMQNRTTGEIISRVEELNEIKNMASEIFINFILNSILIFGATVVLFIISKELFFSLCLVVILYLFIGLIFSKIIDERVKVNIENNANFNTALVEQVEMNYSIKNLNLVSEFLYSLESKLVQMLKGVFNFNYLLNLIETGKNAVYEIGIFTISSLGMYLIYQGKLEILSLVTFNSLILYLFDPVKELVGLLPRYSYLKASFIKLSDFLNIKLEDTKVGLQEISEGDIKVEGLTYSYNKYQNIIENKDFSIRSGEKAILLGPSGVGKSTICKILFRYLNSYQGKILINSMDEKDYSLKAIRENILYVGQNEKLFSGTIRENIICFRNVLEEEFQKVVRICRIEDIVSKKPNRYETFINASINNLSGGEKQRIILARALLKKATILILDEALSEVNIELEKDILDEIFKNYRKETLIYVTHKDVSDKFTKVIDLATL